MSLYKFLCVYYHKIPNLKFDDETYFNVSIFNKHIIYNNNLLIAFIFRLKEASTPSETPATPAAATTIITTTPLPATPVAIPIKTVNRKSRVPVLSETDNSDLEGTPNPTKKTPHQLPNHSTTNTPTSQNTEQLDTNDRMSKEKQKFFRTSAFNAEKKKGKDKKEQCSQKNNAKDKVSKENDENRTNSKTERPPNKKVETDRRTRSNDTPAAKKVTTPRSKNVNVGNESEIKDNIRQQKTRSQQKNSSTKNVVAAKNKPVPVPEPPQEIIADEEEVEEEEQHEESSSDETSSSSSCSSESDTDSSVDNSDSKVSMRNIKIPEIFNVTNEKKEPTFGSISGISVDKDAPWGFAAAAAEGKSGTSNKTKSSENLFISVLKEEGLLKDNADTNSSQDEDKSDPDKSQKSTPGYGQLKGLFDGLSHLFIAPTESRASRSQPNYNPNRRKPKDGNDEENKEIKEEIKEPKVKLEPIIVVEREKEKPEIKSQPKSSIPSTPSIPKMKSTTPQFPNSPKPVVPKDEVVSMTPSGLVKTAVNSKQHERRKLIKSEANDAQQKCNNDANDARITKKRNHVTTGQIAATNQPLSATLPFTTNNQTGKIGYPHLPLHNDHHLSHNSPLLYYKLSFLVFYTRSYFFTCA